MAVINLNVWRQSPNLSKVLKGVSIKGGIERDGVLFVMKGEKEKEAEKELMKWLQEIKML